MNVNDAHWKLGHIGKKLIWKTLNYMGIKAVGKMKTCEACKLSQTKKKKVQKFTLTKAKKPGERVFIDLTGPFTKEIGGQRYWFQVVDDTSRRGFNYFTKTKTEIGIGLEK